MLKSIIQSWYWEDTFLVLVWLALFLILDIFYSCVNADRRVDCYYLGSRATQAGVSYQIMGNVNWNEDVVAFSSSDPDKTMEVFAQLPQKCGEQ